ncbi:ABC transporter permease [Thioalkalicoccus limnaeus]|uniref:ABC transporter permease n=1 Tax=Thioalkalicoccus limnaeus TaxID=120681 RepID=A0ABV4BGZ7_9GAMM
MTAERRINALTLAGGVLLALLVTLVVFGGAIAPHDPNQIDLTQRLQAPSLAHPFGTDQLGRCVASRILAGAAMTLSAGVGASLLAFAAGLIIGVGAGLLGGRGDWLLMRLVDVALAFPGLVLALVLAGFLPPSPTSLTFALALAAWPWWARLSRGLAREAATREYVVAARALGLGWPRLLTRYLLPQLWPSLSIALAVRTGGLLAAVAGLSYLGLGAQPPTPEWGRMLEEARVHMGQAPWLMLAPGLALTVAIAACHLFAEGLRDQLAMRRTEPV